MERSSKPYDIEEKWHEPSRLEENRLEVKLRKLRISTRERVGESWPRP